jgi:hypothetical protein
MSYEQAGPLLNALGQSVAEILGEVPEAALLYAEVGDGWQEAGIFKEMAGHVLYKHPDTDLCDDIGRIWEQDDTEQRWIVMLYRIQDGKFSTEFIYPDDLDPDEDTLERRQRILIELYGDKPVDYSNP